MKFVLMLSALAMAIDQYQQCFQCFFLHREDFYFCESSGECLPSSWAGCPDTDRITDKNACGEGVDVDCPQYTFTNETFGMEPELFNVTLTEGTSCSITINRTSDGSYGTMAIKTEDPYLLVYDEDIFEYVSKEPLGLIEVDSYDGWEPRTVFLANIGLVPSEFEVAFDHAHN